MSETSRWDMQQRVRGHEVLKRGRRAEAQLQSQGGYWPVEDIQHDVEAGGYRIMGGVQSRVRAVQCCKMRPEHLFQQRASSKVVPCNAPVGLLQAECRPGKPSGKMNMVCGLLQKCLVNNADFLYTCGPWLRSKLQVYPRV